MSVVSLDEVRKAREQHWEGPAKCMKCGHDFDATQPMDELGQYIECPECKLVFGVFRFPYERAAAHWECNCGNDLFHLTPQGPYCPSCGVFCQGHDK